MKFFKSINFKIISFASILAAIFLAAILFIIVFYARGLFEKQLVDIMEQRIALYGTQIEQTFIQVDQDIEALGKATNVADVLYDSTFLTESGGFADQNIEKVKNVSDLFETVSRSKKIYNQLRLINKHGEEVVRVDYIDGQTVVVPAERLQDKSDRAYVQQTNLLSAGQVYISNPNLNREGSPPTIQVPYVPVVRYAIPIFSAQGERLGMVVANVNISDVLNKIEQLTKELASQGTVMITDRNGYYVFHPDSSKQWGGPEDLATDQTLVKDFPEISKGISKDEVGVRVGEKYFFTKKIFLSERDQRYYLSVVQVSDSTALFSPFRKFAIVVGFLGFGFFTLLFFVFLFFIKYLLSPLSNLSYAVSQIGDGVFSTKVAVEHDDEIGIVATSFNKMAEKLSGIYSNLEQQVQTKTKDLSDKVNELEDTKKAMMNVLEDVESDKADKEKLANELLKFKQAVDAATDMIIITDPNGTVIYGNRAVKTLTGYDASEAIGKKAAALWKMPMSHEYYADMWATIKDKKQDFKSHVKNRRKDGTEYDAEVTISPVIDDQNNVLFFIGIERDISKEKEYERTSQRLKLATESANIGIWEWDIKNDVLVWDENMYALYGIKEHDFSGAYDAWQKVLHPDDKKRGEEEIKKAIAGETKFDTEFRVVWPSGQIHHIKASALVERDKAGEALRMVGVNWDITHDKEVDKAKSEFVSLASHQLRTPLSAVNWYTEMLLAGDAGEISDTQEKYLNEIYSGNHRMVELVNALLNVSRLELGTFLVEPKPIDLKNLAESVISEQRPMIDKKSIKLDKDISENMPTIEADPKLLRIIMQNLLSNAVKYTDATGLIKFDLKLDDAQEKIIFSVADNGMGIPADQQDMIFNKLFRADNVKESDTEGTGLGLYIVKSILDNAGGKIWFVSPYQIENSESKNETSGTIFQVELPLDGMRQRRGSKSLD